MGARAVTNTTDPATECKSGISYSVHRNGLLLGMSNNLLFIGPAAKQVTSFERLHSTPKPSLTRLGSIGRICPLSRRLPPARGSAGSDWSSNDLLAKGETEPFFRDRG